MKDHELVSWLADRMVHVYGESPNVDFVHRARAVAENIESQATTIARYETTAENYELLQAKVDGLEAWKAEELTVMNPLMDYARSACTGPLGCSLPEWLFDDHKAMTAKVDEQAREIERLEAGVSQHDAELVELLRSTYGLCTMRDMPTEHALSDLADRIDAKLATLSAKNEGGKA